MKTFVCVSALLLVAGVASACDQFDAQQFGGGWSGFDWGGGFAGFGGFSQTVTTLPVPVPVRVPVPIRVPVPVPVAVSSWGGGWGGNWGGGFGGSWGGGNWGGGWSGGGWRGGGGFDFDFGGGPRRRLVIGIIRERR